MPVIPDDLFRKDPEPSGEVKADAGREAKAQPVAREPLKWLENVRMTRDAKDLLRSLVFLTQFPKYIGAADRVETCASDPSDTTS